MYTCNYYPKPTIIISIFYVKHNSSLYGLDHVTWRWFIKLLQDVLNFFWCWAFGIWIKQETLNFHKVIGNNIGVTTSGIWLTPLPEILSGVVTCGVCIGEVHGYGTISLIFLCFSKYFTFYSLFSFLLMKWAYSSVCVMRKLSFLCCRRAWKEHNKLHIQEWTIQMSSRRINSSKVYKFKIYRY